MRTEQLDDDYTWKGQMYLRSPDGGKTEVPDDFPVKGLKTAKAEKQRPAIPLNVPVQFAVGTRAGASGSGVELDEETAPTDTFGSPIEGPRKGEREGALLSTSAGTVRMDLSDKDKEANENEQALRDAARLEGARPAGIASLTQLADETRERSASHVELTNETSKDAGAPMSSGMGEPQQQTGATGVRETGGTSGSGSGRSRSNR